MSICETLFAPYAAFIPDFAAFCAALQTPRTCCLRVNTLRATPEAVRALLVCQGYQVTPSPLSEELLLVDNLPHPGRLREAFLGYYHPQALTSALASLSLAPQPGELVCDLCAAPGSKTSHMAQLMRNRGVIVANEPAHERLFMLDYNLKHLGISNVVTTRYTGQNFPLRCKFTRVLVDAPCSGEGNYRWDTQGRQQRARSASSGTPEDLPRLQQQLLVRGFDIPHMEQLAVLQVQSVGLPVLRIMRHHLKPTTVALQCFGSQATCHILDLSMPSPHWRECMPAETHAA